MNDEPAPYPTTHRTDCRRRRKLACHCTMHTCKRLGVAEFQSRSKYYFPCSPARNTSREAKGTWMHCWSVHTSYQFQTYSMSKAEQYAGREDCEFCWAKLKKAAYTVALLKTEMTMDLVTGLYRSHQFIKPFLARLRSSRSMLLLPAKHLRCVRFFGNLLAFLAGVGATLLSILY